jgi:hypothetical protein
VTTQHNASITDTIASLYSAWLNSLSERQFDWLESHLAEDLTATARPFEKFALNKRQLIDLDKKIESVKTQLLEVYAHRAGNIVLSHIVLRFEHASLSEEPGNNLPSAAEHSRLFTGKTVAYASAWRFEDEIWKCFDHHMVGAIA